LKLSLFIPLLFVKRKRKKLFLHPELEILKKKTFCEGSIYTFENIWSPTHITKLAKEDEAVT